MKERGKDTLFKHYVKKSGLLGYTIRRAVANVIITVNSCVNSLKKITIYNYTTSVMVYHLNIELVGVGTLVQLYEERRPCVQFCVNGCPRHAQGHLKVEEGDVVL